MSQRILVTGAGGFVGRRLVRALRDTGADVFSPARDTLDVVLGVFPDQYVDQVIHLAARTYVPESWADPSGFYRVNAQGTVNVLDFCRRIGARLVHVSAYCYGEPLMLPISESAPLRPNNPYALSKVAAEDACRFFSEHYGMALTILRPFNLYGPGQPSRFLIPRLVEQALDAQLTEIVVEDDSPRRDYVYVDDFVAAICAVCANSKSGSVYNVGSGESHSVAEIAKLICQIADVEKPVVSRGNRRPKEIMDVIADITAIRREMEWSPSVGLLQGLRKVMAERNSASSALIETAARLNVVKSRDDGC
jgi:nucleoside-diphosphate-sugar epimerase